MPSANQNVRVNVLTRINAAGIRRETRHGREKIIVPSATMPDDIVMNDIKYPAAEIAASFETLNGTPAPLGHPTLNGYFCPASSTEAMVRNGIGAENENVRQVEGKNGGKIVLVDKVIDVEFAKLTNGGQAVLDAIEKGDPIHSSTGLLCELENAAAGSDSRYIARNIYFDHDAILLDEEGAATPEQGVGLMVNSKGEQIEVVNSTIQEEIDRELDWAADWALRTLEKEARVPLIEGMKSALRDFLSGRETSANTETDMADNEQIAALSKQVTDLSETVGKIPGEIGDAISNAMKPLVDAQNASAEAEKQKAEAERTEAVNKLVDAKVFADADEAKDMPIAALNKLLEVNDNKLKPAAGLNAAMPSGAKTNGFKAPAAEDV